MRFQVTHSFPFEPEQVADAILDLDYQHSLKDLESLRSRELLSQEERPDRTVVRRTRCVLDLHVSGMAKSFMGDGDPAWIEEATWDPGTRRWRWVVIPEVAKEMLDANGTIELTPRGDTTDRTIEGEVKVKVPIYGSKVERWIVDGIEHAYAEEAERLEAWLAHS